MDPTGRTSGATGGLPPDLANFLASSLDFQAETDRMIAAGELEDVNVLNWLFSLGPNLIASAIDEGYEFDENRTYATYLVEKGVPWGVAGVLGSALDLIEPGPGEFKAAAAGITGAGAGLSRLLTRLPAEETLWRIQDRVTGRGPFWDIPTTTVARGNRSGLPVSYHTSEPTYVSNTIHDFRGMPGAYGSDVDSMEVLMSTPRAGSNTLDTTQMNVEAMTALLDAIKANSGIPPQQQAHLIRSFERAIAAQDPLDQSEALRDLALMGGMDRFGAPHQVGIDVLRQLPDDNYAVSRLLGSVPPTESVVFNPNALDVQEVMTPDQFLYRQLTGNLPRATRPFPLEQLAADARAGGFTFNPRDGSRPTSGFAFSERPDIETIVPLDRFSEADLESFILRNQGLLESPENYLGAWVDNGNVYMDVSTIIADREEALRRALAAQQLGVFDLSNFTTIDTGFRRP